VRGFLLEIGIHDNYIARDEIQVCMSLIDMISNTD
jgi:hypothetical protein